MENRVCITAALNRTISGEELDVTKFGYFFKPVLDGYFFILKVLFRDKGIQGL